ncbi:MAG: hypothetical protein N2578_01915 [Bdellovibrionaceae bacterium]|nr:hypothetical protein [Pseudobdellovibrionaceae bacterium]
MRAYILGVFYVPFILLCAVTSYGDGESAGSYKSIEISSAQTSSNISSEEGHSELLKRAWEKQSIVDAKIVRPREGLLEDKKKIVNSVKNLYLFMGANRDKINLKPSDALFVIKENLESYEENWSSCHKLQHEAQNKCLQSKNAVYMQQVGNAMALGLRLIRSGGGNNVICSGLDQTFDTMHKANIYYLTHCAQSSKQCAAACQPSEAGLRRLSEILKNVDFDESVIGNPDHKKAVVQADQMKTALLGELKDSFAKELDPSVGGVGKGMGVASKSSSCSEDFFALLGTAATVGNELAKLIAEANFCKRQVGGGSGNDRVVSSPEDCSDPIMAATNPMCICQLRPGTPGCGSGHKPGEELSTGPGVFLPPGENNLIGSDLGDPSVGDLGDDPFLAKDSPEKKKSLEAIEPKFSGGFSSAGASGAGDIFSGGQSGKDKGAGTAPALTTDMYSGFGGGGGGSRWGGRGISGEKSEYERPLPGGRSAVRASGEESRDQISSGGGKSNWEKISERYISNRPTLLSGN